MQMYLSMVCAMIHAHNTTHLVARSMSWLFPSCVNLPVMSRVNISFHNKFWYPTHEKLCGAMTGISRMCEVVVEQYHICTTQLH